MELQIVVTQLHLMPLQSLQSVAQLVTLVGVVAVTIVAPQLIPLAGQPIQFVIQLLEIPL